MTTTPVAVATEDEAAGEPIECGVVRFHLHPAIADGVSCELVAAVSGSDSVPPWEVGPEHVRLTLNGYRLVDTFHMPSLYAYPTAEFAAANETAAAIIEQLDAWLSAPPAGFEGAIPFLPLFNAAQMLTAKTELQDFQNGNGVRFLTLYGQAYRIVNNHELFYTYQGLTDDGAYYLSAVLPVSHPSLPEGGDIPPDEFEAFVDSYEANIAAAVAALNDQADETYFPDLTLLDGLIASVQIE